MATEKPVIERVTWNMYGEPHNGYSMTVNPDGSCQYHTASVRHGGGNYGGLNCWGMSGLEVGKTYMWKIRAQWYEIHHCEHTIARSA